MITTSDATDNTNTVQAADRTDDFEGDNSHLVDCIDALLDLDDANALVPHGLGKGSHAYRLLVAARHRLAQSTPADEGLVRQAFKEGFSYGNFAGGGNAGNEAEPTAWVVSKTLATLRSTAADPVPDGQEVVEAGKQDDKT